MSDEQGSAWGWRSPEAEENLLSRRGWGLPEAEENILRRRGSPEAEKKHPCNWYQCADPGMEGELVLVYSYEKTKDFNSTSIVFPDRYLQKLTASGKKCSGRIGKCVKKANPGTYNQDGTYKLNDTI